MTRITHFGLTLSCVLTLCSLLGCQAGQSQQTNEKETRILTAEHRPGHGLAVRTSNGAITVRHADRPDVRITAKLRATTQERLLGVVIVAERDDAGTLHVYADWPGDRKPNEACSFELALPDATDIKLTSSNGALNIEGLGDSAELRTSNGSIKVDQLAGPAKARTSNGAIKLQYVQGPIDAQSSNGTIDIRNSPGPVTARTSNGAIHARHISQTFNLNTSNGEVTILLEPNFAGEVELRTSLGKMEMADLGGYQLLESGKKRVHLRLGKATDLSTAHTSIGRIKIWRLDP